MPNPDYEPLSVYPPALKTLRDPIASPPITGFWAPDDKESHSPYQHLVPEVPSPDRTAQDRERIISDGTIPSVVPAALGLRIWLAERRISRNQSVAEKLLGRKARVAAFVGQQIIQQEGYQGFDKEFRPQNAAEKIMAWRMHAKWRKATVKGMNKNNLAAPYYVTIREPGEDTNSIKLDPNQNFDNLSSGEKRRARKSKRQHDRLARQADILMYGRATPIAGKRVNGFEQFMTKPAKKANKAIEKRDNAVRKAEALRRQKAAKSSKSSK
jgi:hypothetical protein